MEARFGPAGNSTAFSAKYKSSLHAPAYLKALGLTAYEYQCGRGVTVKEETARKMGAAAAQSGIALSLHAPYYISMAAKEEQKRIDGNFRYFLASAAAARAMGATRIVFHPGGAGGRPRAQCMALVLETLRLVLALLEEKGYGDLVLCAEMMGKQNQLGTPEEIIALCRAEERILPCIDFGHINARGLGALAEPEAVAQLFDKLEQGIGMERARVFHGHYSKIAYSAGGEVRHLTMDDAEYGPDFAPIARQCVQRGYAPTFICESDGVQDTDAVRMLEIYKNCKGE